MFNLLLKQVESNQIRCKKKKKGCKEMPNKIYDPLRE